MVTLLVGKKKAKAVVAKDHLCEVSSFFKSAFTSQFKESSDQSIQLPEDTVATVEDFIQWLYTRQFSVDTSDKNVPACVQALRLLVFADKYDVPILQKQLFEVLIGAYPKVKVPGMGSMRHVYENSSKGSGIRVLMAEWYVSVCDQNWLLKYQEWLLEIPELAVDMLIASEELRNSGRKDLVSTRSPEYYMQGRNVTELADE